MSHSRYSDAGIAYARGGCNYIGQHTLRTLHIMITGTVLFLLMLFVGIRFSKKHRRIRHQQWHVRDWIKTIKGNLITSKSKNS
jgi:hypothetical protein